jgi:hypothetical protein
MVAKLELGLQTILALCEQDERIHARLRARVLISQLHISNVLREYLLLARANWPEEQRATLDMLLEVCHRVGEPAGLAKHLDKACIEAIRLNLPFDPIIARYAIASRLAKTTVLELPDHIDELRRYGADAIPLQDLPPDPEGPPGRPTTVPYLRVMDGGSPPSDAAPESSSPPPAPEDSRRQARAV